MSGVGDPTLPLSLYLLSTDVYLDGPFVAKIIPGVGPMVLSVSFSPLFPADISGLCVTRLDPFPLLLSTDILPVWSRFTIVFLIYSLVSV